MAVLSVLSPSVVENLLRRFGRPTSCHSQAVWQLRGLDTRQEEGPRCDNWSLANGSSVGSAGLLKRIGREWYVARSSKDSSGPL